MNMTLQGEMYATFKQSGKKKQVIVKGIGAVLLLLYIYTL